MEIKYEFMVDRRMYFMGTPKDEIYIENEIKYNKLRAGKQIGEKILEKVTWEMNEANFSPADDRKIFTTEFVVFSKVDFDYFLRQMETLCVMSGSEKITEALKESINTLIAK